MKRFITKDNFHKLIVIAIWILIWQLGAVIINQSLYLPSPIQALSSLIKLVQNKNFYISIGATFLRVIQGLGASIILGILLSILSAKFKIAKMFLHPIVSIMKPIPIMSIIILLLVWLKGTNVPIAVCILLCFPVIYTNTLEGIMNVDKELLEMAKVFKVNKKRIYKDIVLPLVKPYLISGIMICIGFSWKAVITSEVLSAPKYSMGYNLYNTKLYLDTQGLFAWTIVIIIFSIAIESIFKKILINMKKAKTN